MKLAGSSVAIGRSSPETASIFAVRAMHLGSKGQYADVAVHTGLICLNGPVGMDLDLQLEMFEAALDELDRNEDLVNEVLEISLSDSNEEFEVLRYKMPAENA
jgi:hypothetical protein